MDFPDRAALLVIDMQKSALPGRPYEVPGLAPAADRIAALAAACRHQGIPVIYTRHVYRSDGGDAPRGEPVDSAGRPLGYRADSDDALIMDEVRPAPSEPVIDKTRWSAFFATGLDLILRRGKVDDLILCGIVTDGCVLASALDGFSLGYRIHLVKDACAAATPAVHAAAVLLMANNIHGLCIYRADELLAALDGNPHRCWEWREPGGLPFGADNLMELYEKL
ncbi:MAG: cysteine hydrolase [Firmicutes bacterium]|nr:cysteine hydrolase [Bacillota bacterium]